MDWHQQPSIYTDITAWTCEFCDRHWVLTHEHSTNIWVVSWTNRGSLTPQFLPGEFVTKEEAEAAIQQTCQE